MHRAFRQGQSVLPSHSRNLQIAYRLLSHEKYGLRGHGSIPEAGVGATDHFLWFRNEDRNPAAFQGEVPADLILLCFTLLCFADTALKKKKNFKGDLKKVYQHHFSNSLGPLAVSMSHFDHFHDISSPPPAKRL